MPFRDDFNRILWSVLLGFIIFVSLAIITIPKENIIYIIIYCIAVFVCFEIYFLLKFANCELRVFHTKSISSRILRRGFLIAVKICFKANLEVSEVNSEKIKLKKIFIILTVDIIIA